MRSERRTLILLNLPLIIVLGFLTLYPFGLNIYLSFTNATLFNYSSPTWLGLGNYFSLIVQNNWFTSSSIITLVFVAFTVSIEFALGLGLALLVSSMKRGVRIAVTLLMIPMIIAPVIIGTMYVLMLNSLVGVIPYLLSLAGLPQPSLTQPGWSLLTIMIIDIWEWTPFLFIIIYAALQALPRQPFEAAVIDGASRFDIFRRITLPLIMPVTSIGILIRGIDAFRVFDVPFILTGGGPGAPVGPTTTLSLLIYRLAFQYDEFGVAAALTFLVLIVVNLFVMGSFRTFAKSLSK